jgi:hypothetical protein
MNREGPTLQLLLRRLAETPSDFLAEPRTPSGRGRVHVPAVVGDLFALHGHPLTAYEDFLPDDTIAAKRRAGVALVLCWLLAERELIAVAVPAAQLHALLTEGAAELAAQLSAEKYITDPERREELARFALARLDLRPRGESMNHAQDRLSALSSAERARVITASRQAELRARQVREALARKAAQESADKYTRE